MTEEEIAVMEETGKDLPQGIKEEERMSKEEEEMNKKEQEVASKLEELEAKMKRGKHLRPWDRGKSKLPNYHTYLHLYAFHNSC